MRRSLLVVGLALAALPFAAPTVLAATCPAPANVTAPAEDWVACVDPLFEQAMKDIEILAADDMGGRGPATEGSAKARAYIIQRLTAIGAPPLFATYEHRFTFEDEDEDRKVDGTNIVARIPGTGTDGKIIVLTAHYDHLGTRRRGIYNGADDNASGVSALLALAQLLIDAPPEHTVIIALVDAEEVGFYGSTKLVDDPAFPRADVALDINLDMISKGIDGELFAMGSAVNPDIDKLIEALPVIDPVRLVKAHDSANDESYEDWTNDSDQYAFHRRGIPWLYFANEEHEEYHEPTDDFATVKPDFFKASITTALAALRIADDRLETIRPVADEDGEDRNRQRRRRRDREDDDD